MNKMYLVMLVGAVASIAAAFVGRAYAGATTATPVTIQVTKDSNGTIIAWKPSGMLGTARSTSGSGWIGCWVNVVDGFGSGGCGASDGTTSIDCKFPFDAFPLYAHQLHALTSDSYINFKVQVLDTDPNPNDNVHTFERICTFLQVNSYSYDQQR